MGETTIEARVERLLDRLENPNLSEPEAAAIQRRIEFMQGLAKQE